MANDGPDGGAPLALFVSILLMIVVAGVGIAAASPDTEFPSMREVVLDSDPDQSATQPAAGASSEPATPSANEQYLAEDLGAEFVVQGEEAVAERAEGLPDETTAHATVSVLSGSSDPFACAKDTETVTCREDTVDGKKILVETQSALNSAAGSNFGQITVHFRRDSGEDVIVVLNVLGKPSGGSTPELVRDVEAWLEAMEDLVVKAAIDDRMTVLAE